MAKIHHIPKIIAHSHNSDVSSLKIKLLHYLNRHLLIPRIASDFLGCSDSAVKWGFQGTKALKQAKVITNGIDLENYKYNSELRNKKRLELSIDENEFVIGTVGRLTFEKNQKFLIEILESLVKKQKKEFKLIIIGIGDLENELKEYAKFLGILDRVLFLGLRKDVGAILNVMDAFVLPSIHEGLPFVAIEAQANNLPTFISNAVSEQIKLIPSTLLLSLNEGPDKWAEEIIKGIDNNNRKQSNSSLGLKHYSIETTVTEMLEVYGIKGNKLSLLPSIN